MDSSAQITDDVRQSDTRRNGTGYRRREYESAKTNVDIIIAGYDPKIYTLVHVYCSVNAGEITWHHVHVQAKSGIITYEYPRPRLGRILTDIESCTHGTTSTSFHYSQFDHSLQFIKINSEMPIQLSFCF